MFKVASIDKGTNGNNFKGFQVLKIGAAFSLLNAWVVHELYAKEPSLLEYSRNAWINAGHFLLLLYEDSYCGFLAIEGQTFPWDHLKKLDLEYRCLWEEDFANNSKELTNCIRSLSDIVWPFLMQDIKFFKFVNSPVKFDWLHRLMTTVLDEHVEYDLKSSKNLWSTATCWVAICSM